MADVPYTPFAKPAPPRALSPSEPLWTLGKASRRVTCELRDDGVHGCEAQLLRDGAFYAGRRFADRAQALAHTETVRARLARDGWSPVDPDA